MDRLRRTVGVALAGTVVLAGSMAVAEAPASAAPAPAPVLLADFTTPGAYAWTVPAGVTAVTVDAYGAGSESGVFPDTGGRGGQTTATLAVRPGDVLQVNVGGKGRYQSPGGFNGGGAARPGSPFWMSGGGASDVRVGACAASATCGLGDRVIVAGGAGGDYSGEGGNGGGLVGQSGARLGPALKSSATGGTQTAGGQGSQAFNPAESGWPGAFGVGGDMGYNTGGGGGGGWFGGGGGSWNGSGGGGSSYLAPGIDGTMAVGVQKEDGRVTIAKAKDPGAGLLGGLASLLTGLLGGGPHGTGTFPAIGERLAFVVPLGVHSLTATLAGASGGDGSVAEGSQAAVTPGGKGAVVTATLAVTPGQVLYVSPGREGTAPSFALPEGTTGCASAFGGGGAGGFQLGGYSSVPMCGPGGGGASDLRTSTAISSRIVVAGGGGGSAQNLAGWPDPCGPYAGGDSGSQGLPLSPCEPTVVGGQPGTANAGGAGANPYYAANPDHPEQWPAGATCAESPVLGPVLAGGDGTLGQGGEAGRQALYVGGPNWVPVGGAGGGGYYGGGGGAPAWFDGMFCSGLSGGGGGSSYVAPGLKQPRVSQGAREGDGYVTITW